MKAVFGSGSAVRSERYPRGWLVCGFALLGIISCGSSSKGNSPNPSSCSPGDTRVCTGTSACVGGQICRSDSAWSECDCGASSAGGGADNGGAGGPPATGGKAGAGSAGEAAGGSSGAENTEAGFAGASLEGPCPPNVFGHCDTGATLDKYPQYPGYTLHTVEDFPVPLDLDHDPIFTWSDGSPTQTATEFTEQNIQFRDGSMILKEESMCTAEHPDCYPAYSSYAQETTAGVPVAIPARPLVSGELRSRYNNYRYGRYEAKFRGPTTGSDYLSSLFTSRTPRGPVWNEIDFSILPYKPKQTSGGIFSATNSTTLPASNYQWTGDVDVPLKYNIINEHVYAFTWTPSAIDWYVDGTLIKHFSGQPDVPLPTSSAKIMMNIWSYGGNSPDSYTSEVAYEYFRFYKLDAETTYPCSPAPECLKKTAVGDYTAASRNNPSETKYGE